MLNPQEPWTRTIPHVLSKGKPIQLMTAEEAVHEVSDGAAVLVAGSDDGHALPQPDFRKR